MAKRKRAFPAGVGSVPVAPAGSITEVPSALLPEPDVCLCHAQPSILRWRALGHWPEGVDGPNECEFHRKRMEAVR